MNLDSVEKRVDLVLAIFSTWALDTFLEALIEVLTRLMISLGLILLMVVLDFILCLKSNELSIEHCSSFFIVGLPLVRCRNSTELEILDD